MQEADLSRLKTYSAAERPHKVSVGLQAALPAPGASAAELLAAMPDQLGAAELRAIVSAVARARQARRPVVAALGGHVVKAGCAPIIVDLIRRGVITAVACNGSTAIHDMEMATLGATSEEVGETIGDGSFGMVRETLDFFAEAVDRAAETKCGLGQALGRLLMERRPAHLSFSIFAAAHDAEVPATVHVALGTDTVHVAPRLDAAALGAASMRDFRAICHVVGQLGAAPGGDRSADAVGGVWLNIGSAVVLPEVFLKAVAVARNLGANLDAMSTANLDMIRHYRPRHNVVLRPVSAGRGHEVIGHHEILLPLLRQAVIERIEADAR